jgi:hypothetical protein
MVKFELNLVSSASSTSYRGSFISAVIGSRPTNAVYWNTDT